MKKQQLSLAELRKLNRQLTRKEMSEFTAGLAAPDGDGDGGCATGNPCSLTVLDKNYDGKCGTSYGSCKCETDYGDHTPDTNGGVSRCVIP
jgi:hypothetical protein